MRSFFLVLALCAAVAYSYELNYRQVCEFDLKHAAFLEMFSMNPGKTQKDLFMTTFGGAPWEQGKVFRLPDIKRHFINNCTKVADSIDLITKRMKWPNIPAAAPRQVFGQDTMIIHDGFLVPFHTNGGIYAVNFDKFGRSSSPISLTKKSFFNDWWYHMSEWIDFNGDGRLDLLTARARKKWGIPKLWNRGFQGELVWLEQPSNPFSSQWKEHVIMEGPDVSFKTREMDGDSNTLEIVATQFFSKKVTLIQIGLDGTFIRSRVIDDSVGSPYVVEFVDINNDGKDELLITNHETSHENSGVFAYEVPEDIFEGDFVRHDLYTGDAFMITAPGDNQMAPGFPYAVYPKFGETNERPHILIAGDGTQSAHILIPTGNDFDYDHEFVINTEGVVGSIAIDDIDGDGYTDFIVGNYDGGKVYMFTFAP